MPGTDGSVTRWLGRLKAGDRDAVQHLWEGYYPRLLILARDKLRTTPRRMADEEDVALSAIKSFCLAAEAGRFPRLDDRHDLWQVLVSVTLRKAIDLIKYQARARRDWRLETSRAELPPGDGGRDGSALLDLLHGTDPDPGFAAELAEQFEALLGRLGDDELRRIALLKMEGHANREIGAAVGCSIPTVERRLRLIRKRWENETPPNAGEEKRPPRDGGGPAASR